jgi:hypothetical protein
MTLSLRAAAGLVWSQPVPYEPDPRMSTYHEEMLTPFGVAVDEDRLRTGTNVGFTQLAEAVLREMAPPIANPDLLILAYALPDLHPLKSTSSALNHLLGGGSRSFAVAEQGLRAPFTALRIADAYVRAGRYANLALFICDQTTLPYYDPVVHDTPLADSAVLLYFDDTGTGDLWFGGTIRGAVGAGPDTVVKPYLSDVDMNRTLVVLGPWAPAEPLESMVPNLHRVPAGTYCTSVWLDLARHRETWAGQYDALVLCDTDPRSGLCQAALLHRRPAARS